MEITVLVENTTNNNQLSSEHGLSLYIRTQSQKILFDVGASELFEKNAKVLGIDLTKVGQLIISHGHYDHGGGLPRFLELNSHAQIFVHQKAFGDYYSKTAEGGLKYIGLDKDSEHSHQIKHLSKDTTIDNELQIFMNILGTEYYPTGNQRLFMKSNEGIVQDSFAHEQNLVINSKENRILIAGCAHNGIVNIINHINEKIDRPITHVISGFHMYNRKENKSEEPHIINEIGKLLLEFDCDYYTGHCTGDKAYESLKVILKDRIHKISTGDTIIIE